VHGNVGEWCRDWYCSQPHELRPGDGERLVPHACAARVRRGGCWFPPAAMARSALRSAGESLFRGLVGFRPAARVSRR
jgi:formylglycine-generating enzyme required for sulfatase activity